MTDTAPTPTSPKPGWKTTEFRLKVAAFILTALYASGVIPTTGTVATVMAIGATMLGALGYTVSRTLVKTAAALLLVGLLAGPQLACATVKADAAAGKVAVVDCVKADRPAIEALIGELAWDAIEQSAKLGAPDWSALVAAAEARGVVVGGCAFVAFEAARKPAPTPPASSGPAVAALATPPPAPDPAVAALERLRAEFGGVQWQTASGLL